MIFDACSASGRSAWRDGEPRRGVDRLTVHEHAEIQMRAVGDTRPADRRDHFPGLHRAFAFRDRRRQAPEMAVNPDEALMLDQHFESTRALSLGADDMPTRDRPNRRALRGRQIDAGMEDAGLRAAGQDARSKRGRHAGRRHRVDQRVELRRGRRRAGRNAQVYGQSKAQHRRSVCRDSGRPSGPGPRGGGPKLPNPWVPEWDQSA